jgi:hypothetical protein
MLARMHATHHTHVWVHGAGVSVCEREKDRGGKRDRETERETDREREREREREFMC